MKRNFVLKVGGLLLLLIVSAVIGLVLARGNPNQPAGAKIPALKAVQNVDVRGEKHYFVSSSATTGNAGGYSGLDNKCNNDPNAMPGKNYHAYGSGSTNRGFKNGVLYVNKKYGTFGITRTEDPDLCRILHVTCDANWKATGPNYGGGFYTWDTSTASCNVWTSNSSGLIGKFWSDIFWTGATTGTLQPSYSGYNCNFGLHLLCIENSATYSDPGAVCGDNSIQTGEDCDDGNILDDATCPHNCLANGGYCGDGYIGTGETCDTNKISYPNDTSSPTSTDWTRGRCNAACAWTPDQDSDGITGQTDCWNNDANAKPGSTYQSTTPKDYNCSGWIDQRTDCTGGYDAAWFYPPDGDCATQKCPSGWNFAWCELPDPSTRCTRCLGTTTYYW